LFSLALIYVNHFSERKNIYVSEKDMNNLYSYDNYNTNNIILYILVNIILSFLNRDNFCLRYIAIYSKKYL